MMFSDTETDMLDGEPPSASCVQGSDDSRNSAIRIAYRTLLRSSSLWEPRYPSLKIFLVYFYYMVLIISKRITKGPYKMKAYRYYYLRVTSSIVSLYVSMTTIKL